ncbi:zinc-dependent alcohol dehydrogenase family protein [Pseudoduganella sp. OTU4001]|uniref:zinc-dependent alcohol dehydrogenase family protein n=1 Tax=Pseudoduganella sp. OTU4001 TaxID=3043854 RepID=UPI00313D2328
MHAYQITPGAGIDSLEHIVLPKQELQFHQVRVKVRAVALNYRDLMVAHGTYPTSGAGAVVPGSDAAGEIIEVGPGVTRFRVGDRVATAFFPEWEEGKANPAKTAVTLGAGGAGALSEELVIHEDGLVAMPEHLSYEEAATLTCAGVTAWNALFVEGGLQAGDTVLLLGTGGVSIWALQLAKAAGLRAIVTSSSDTKLERARALGADVLINYRKTPEWQEEVLRATEGKGADLVLEVGGQDTLARSIASVGMGGKVAVIGGLGGGFETSVQLLGIVIGGKSMSGIYVGSRKMHEDLARLVSQRKIKPVVDSVFDIHKAREAYQHLASGSHFGKVVISI